VHREAALETIESWYKAMHSSPRNRFVATSPRRVERFVLKDYSGIGVTGSDLLQKMTLRFDLEEIFTSPDADDDAAQQYLDSLYTVKKKRGFQLDVVFTQRRIQLNLWSLAFDLLREILHEFIVAGAIVRNLWEYMGYIAGHIKKELDLSIMESHPNWKVNIIKYFDSVSNMSGLALSVLTRVSLSGNEDR